MTRCEARLSLPYEHVSFPNRLMDNPSLLEPFEYNAALSSPIAQPFSFYPITALLSTVTPIRSK